MRKSFLLFFALMTTAFSLAAQSLYFPPLVGKEWETLSPTTLNWCPEKIETMYSFLENKNSKAFIVLKDGKIVLEKYFGTFKQDSLWYWASAGKTLTGFLIGIAQEEKLLSIEQTTNEFLNPNWTSCPAEKEAKIKIKHQLSMITGLDDGVVNPDCTLPACLKYKADAETRWAYHNAPYTLLDKVIEKAAGKNLNTFFNEKVATKTGMAGMYIKTGDNNVFFSTARTMARYGLLLLNKGKWNNTTILGDMNYFTAMTNSSQTINPSYGYLTWLNGKKKYMMPSSQIVFDGKLCADAPDDMFCAIGKNGQIIGVIPSLNMVFIRMGNPIDAGLNVPNAFVNDLWKEIAKLTCLVPTATEKASAHQIKIFPNPNNSGIFKIEAAENLPIEITVFNALGQKIKFFENTNVIDIREAGRGIFVLTIKMQGQTYTQKLIVE